VHSRRSTWQALAQHPKGRIPIRSSDGTFRNYDVSDGLQTNEFSTGCCQGPDGEMFFGGSNGFNAFFPENVRDNPYVPPVVITSSKIFNKPVSIDANSLVKRAVPYVDSLSLSYRDNVFSFEFAALTYANSRRTVIDMNSRDLTLAGTRWTANGTGYLH
jgi:hypothetical protein